MTEEEELDEDLVTIVKFDDRVEAMLIKGRLEAEGIHAFIHNEWGGSVLPGVGGAAGICAELQVRKCDIEKVDAVLRPLYEEQVKRDKARKRKPEETGLCPKCGSAEIRSPGWFWATLFVLLTLPAIPFHKFRLKFRCVNCGHKWREGRAARSVAVEDEDIPGPGEPEEAPGPQESKIPPAIAQDFAEFLAEKSLTELYETSRRINQKENPDLFAMVEKRIAELERED